MEGAVAGSRAAPAGRVADLARLARLARDVGLLALAAEAERVAGRVAEGRFYVACLGQFKRGKSTLLNALVGESVLPTGVVPVTSVVTVLRHGRDLSARVRVGGDGWREVPVASLAAWVAEEQNPDNRKGVEAVEVFVPAPLLESGMCLVDTPGVGSVFAGATHATRAFVPHLDAALVVLGADPPITGEEASLVESVAGQVDTMLFVLAKADRLSDPERREATRFAREVLEARLGGPIGPILEVSAIEFLAGMGPRRDWDALVARLAALARDSGAHLVRRAEERAAESLSERLSYRIDEQIGALERPIEETERRLGALGRAAAEVERSLGDLHALLQVEQDRLGAALTAARRRFLASALADASRDLCEVSEAEAAVPRSRIRERATERAAEVARRHLDRWLARERPATEERYREATERFVTLANDFLARFEAARDLGLGRLPPLLPREAGFRVAGRLFYTEVLHLASTPLAVRLLDSVRPRRRAMAGALARATAYLERLLTSNSARIQNDLIERAGESRRQLEADIRSRLTEASAAVAHALDQARERQAAGREAVRASLDRLTALRREVEEVRRAR